ncbi:MAG: ABC transporter ATP-binding protein [Spirosomataceae bacterium]
MPIIKAEHISKMYLIDHKRKRKGSVGYRDVLIHQTKMLLNPQYRKEMAEEVDEKEEFWALSDISFEIEKGDKVGIVGSNGAGKSTLLKILSRITEPSSGRVTIAGRVASLLEVGTGFHPELTGRENIFLNGAILGMKREEIRRQFDAIVDFAGIEKFLDTPVKRYSSGMYVRLGFSIGAHLEPEIMIIDEVLAVGDAEFQKKCLGSMQDASKSGRTILFVSHNLTAVQGLCNKAIFLQKGRLVEMGETNHVINTYMTKVTKTQLEQSWDEASKAPGNDMVRLARLAVEPQYLEHQTHVDVRTPLKIKVEFWNFLENAALNVSLHVSSLTGEVIFNVGSLSQPFEKGLISAELDIPGNFMNDGSYSISVMVVKDTATVLFNLEEAIIFDIEDYREGTGWYGKWAGAIRPTSLLPFKIQRKEEIPA